MTLEDFYNLIVGIKPKEEKKKAREPTAINYTYNNLLDKGKEKEQCRTLS